jgi:hypothetical protein
MGFLHTSRVETCFVFFFVVFHLLFELMDVEPEQTLFVFEHVISSLCFLSLKVFV